MLKTNSKQAMENIRATVMEEITYFLEEREIVTDKPATEYFNIIEAEKFYNHYYNDYEMVKDWMQGLGGGFFPAQVFYRGSAVDVIANWLEETEEEAEKYTEQQAEELAVKLFYRELKKMIEKENKKENIYLYNY